MKFIAFIVALLWAGAASAQSACNITQSTSVNPTVGSVMTWCGPSVGAQWIPGTITGPLTSVIGDVAIWTTINGTGLGDPTGTTASRLNNRSANYNTSGNYGGTAASAGLMEILGSFASPDSTQDAVAIFQKWSNSDTNWALGINPTLYVSNIMQNGSDTSRGTAGYFETELNVPAATINNFGEGIRAHGTIAPGMAGGSAYGAICFGGEAAGASHFGYLVGCEGEVQNQSVDAVYAFGTGSSTNQHFEASFVATSRGTKHPFAAFLVNPFTLVGAAFQVGFHVPAASPNVASAPVVGAAFRSDAPSTWGLDLTGHGAGPTFGAIGIPNNVPIRANRADGGATPNILAFDTANKLLLGADNDVASIVLGQGSVTTLQLGSTAMVAANGSVATVLGSVGPVGSHTSVQKWLAVKDNTGATLYVPGF
jgi:hypothetical protein